MIELATAQVEVQAPDCGPSYGQQIGSKSYLIPTLNTEQEAEVGQSIVSAIKIDTHENGIRIREPITVSGRYVWNDFSVTLPADAVLEKIGNGTTREYAVKNAEYRLSGRVRGSFMSPVVTVAVRPSDPSKAIMGINWGLVQQFHEFSLPAEAVQICSRVGPGGFRRELLYGGVSQGSISLEYREFFDDFARPAFSQTLRYDLNEGREIGFRGARFEILAANNVAVRYRVVRSFEQ